MSKLGLGLSLGVVIIACVVLISTRAYSQPPVPKIVLTESKSYFSNVALDPHNPQRLFATSTIDGIYRSDDGGKSWSLKNQGLNSKSVTSLVVSPENSEMLFVATSAGLFVSHNSGNTWVTANNLKGQISFISPDNYKPIALDPRNAHRVCIGTYRGKVLCSENEGIEWRDFDPKHEIFPARPIRALEINGEGKLFVGNVNGVVRCVIDTLKCERLKGPTHVTDIALSKDATTKLYVAGNRKLWTSFNTGTDWQTLRPMPKGFSYRLALDEDNNRIFVIWLNGWSGGLFVSNDNGGSWIAPDPGTPSIHSKNPTWDCGQDPGLPTSIHYASQTRTLYRTDKCDIWKSQNAAQSWEEIGIKA